MEHEPVSVIVNVYNEAETIERELREIHAAIIARLPGSELIVAEDGSTDGTKEILARLQDELGIIHSTGPTRKGYAKAFRDAVALARNPYVFFSDTGGKLDFNEFWKLYEHRHQYDVISGTRSERTDQWYRRFLTWSYNALLRFYFQVELRDADAGFRLYRTEAIRKIAAEPWVNKYLIASELALRAIYSGYSFQEVPIAYRQRAGSSRGLPLAKIPRAIGSVVRNFPTVKRAITAPGYRTGPAAVGPGQSPPAPAAPAHADLSWTAKLVLLLLGALALGMLLFNASTMTICEDETGGFYLDVRPTAEVIEFLLANQCEDPPLYDLIQHLWVPWAGYHVGRLRALPIAFWLAMLPGIFLVARRLAGPRAAWFTLAAVLLMPYHWTIPAVARWYSLYACLAVWNFLFLLRIIDAPSTSDAAGEDRKTRFLWAGLYVFTGTCLWYTNYSAIVLFFTHLIVALGRARFRGDALRTLVVCWAMIGLAFLPWLPVFFRQLGISTRPFSPVTTAQSLYCLLAGELSNPYRLAFSLPAAATGLLLALLVFVQPRRSWIPVIVGLIVLSALISAGAIRPKRLTLMSPFLALTFGLVLGNAIRGPRWQVAARYALIVVALMVVGGAGVNVLRRSDWLAYRWLDPCQEAAQRVQSENADAVVLTNSNPVLFYLKDEDGINWDLREAPEDRHGGAKTVVLPLKPPRLERLKSSLAAGRHAVWIHHAATAPISKSYGEILRTMERFGYSVVKTEALLRPAPEFLRYHPRYRGRALQPLDRYRIVLVHFAKRPSATLATRPDGAARQ